MDAAARDRLTSAIQLHCDIQLAYRRRDGSTSVHIVAPIDVREGDTKATETQEYLWAFCYAENQAEMHKCERILSVRVMETKFDPTKLLDAWPVDRWPLPSQWRVARSW